MEALKQIIPCNVKMWAVYDTDEGEIKIRIIAFGLDEDGLLRPLAFDEEMGSSYADEAINFDRYEMEEGVQCQKDMRK